ncbi:hypothetical protein TNCT_2251 [Trichonephila clavata]|uniref:Uncharacterized protein n=1 Tax=Trichonephila clavata TaxID=2740835 RepID=A0A8X6K8W4_TRICU|nr:hypothetical protein TNCT_2251 [Trichonephila clavata]
MCVVGKSKFSSGCGVLERGRTLLRQYAGCFDEWKRTVAVSKDLKRKLIMDSIRHDLRSIIHWYFVPKRTCTDNVRGMVSVADIGSGEDFYGPLNEVRQGRFVLMHSTGSFRTSQGVLDSNRLESRSAVYAYRYL